MRQIFAKTDSILVFSVAWSLLSDAVELTGGRKEQYKSASSSECVAACTKMVFLLTGRQPKAASTSGATEKSGPKAATSNGDESEKPEGLGSWIRERVSGVKQNVETKVSDRVYERAYIIRHTHLGLAKDNIYHQLSFTDSPCCA